MAKKVSKKKGRTTSVRPFRSRTVAKPGAAPGELLKDLRLIIAETRAGIAQTVNSALVQIYWHLGQRIRRDILDDERAAYGRQILATLSQGLVAEFGSGYDQTNLSRMVKFRNQVH